MPLLSYMVWQPGVWKRREAKCDVWRPASMTRRGCLKGHRQYQKRKKEEIQVCCRVPEPLRFHYKLVLIWAVFRNLTLSVGINSTFWDGRLRPKSLCLPSPTFGPFLRICSGNEHVFDSHASKKLALLGLRQLILPHCLVHQKPRHYRLTLNPCTLTMLLYP
ncbi:hypothetical protein FOC1_g10009703 [Fusarium oxysporum f. sp. cubense race 1]|uniref:Uncharacterized protein n=1 Tax=Fusarium oxysporum f. sp. cubense (strain race 1) TaxID=1229664 RepID=N4UNS6_FUSC1|nr:hypothetical protein FOC1_g10009703 [Fusarium oxysporum f. sp. cubense race 1]